MKLKIIILLLGGLLVSVLVAYFDIIPKIQLRWTLPSKPLTILERKQDLEGEYKFSLDLLKHIPDQNAIVSPIAIRLALGMALAGAKGETSEEIAKTLQVENNDQAHNVFASTLEDLPSNMEKNQATQFQLIEKVWGQKGSSYYPRFRTILEQKYKVTFEPLDFCKETEKSREIINTWFNEQTLGTIEEFLGQEVDLSGSKLLLTNAIYLNAKWKHPFERIKTSSESFYVTKEQEVLVQLMHEKREFPFANVGTAKILKLPYFDDAHSMLIVLPEGHTLQKVEEGLNAHVLSEWMHLLKPTEVDVKFPKLEMTRLVKLKESLKQMGIRRAFDPNQANFTGMTQGPRLMIDEVLHQTKVDIDEDGTQIVAATAVKMIPISAMMEESFPTIFHADHPFLFFILDKKHGHILFMGRVVDPSK